MLIRKFTLLTLCLLLFGCGTNQDGPTIQVAIPDVSPDQQDDRPNSNRPNPIVLTVGQTTKTVYEATIIDTEKFPNQIGRTEPFSGTILTTSVLRTQEAEAPEIRLGRPNELFVDGAITETERIHHQALFPGISQSLFDPPDPTLAAGPNHIVQMVNSEIAFFTKDGTVQFQAILGSQGSPGFFEDVGGEDFCVDPRCFYDHYAGRFVVLCLEVYLGSGESYLTIAVSDDDDPNGIWFKYRPSAVYNVGGSNNFADYPSIGFDANGYYISGNLFTFGFSFNGVGFRTMDKTPMLTGQPITVNDFFDTGFFTFQMAQNFGASTFPYGVSLNSSTAATIIAINDPFGSPSFSEIDVSIPAFAGSGNANNQGGSVSTLGGRPMNAHCRDGKLYTCHSVDSGNRSVVRWYQFNIGNWPSGPAPTLDQSGDINLGAGQHTFFPAIYSNSNGSVAVVFANSSNGELISVNASGRLASDPPGTMGAPVEFDISSTVANGRYGDYFDIAIDPADDLTFWMVGETSENFGWDTVVNSFAIDLLLGDVNCDGAVNLLDVDPFVELISSGTFQEKADMNQDGSVNLLDVGPFVALLANG